MNKQTKCKSCSGTGMYSQCNDCFDNKEYKKGCNICVKCISCTDRETSNKDVHVVCGKCGSTDIGYEVKLQYIKSDDSGEKFWDASFHCEDCSTTTGLSEVLNSL